MVKKYLESIEFACLLRIRTGNNINSVKYQDNDEILVETDTGNYLVSIKEV